jgi:hypothetical protein
VECGKVEGNDVIYVKFNLSGVKQITVNLGDKSAMYIRVT